jgi:alkaline phosphatase D
MRLRNLRVSRTEAWRVALVVLLLAAACAAQSLSPVIEVPDAANTAAQEAKPYVVLVSLDGFRYDYATKYGAKNISAMGARGASTPDGMIPSFPSLTFPNHYTIVTGLYPEHHGIVANSFYDPVRKETYSYTNPKTASDGSLYGGTPLWVLAEQQGMRAACFFWPGSEAEIQGKRPSYYLKYDDGFPDDKRVEQVLAWLHLPPEKRPHFITLYISDVDHAGHLYGPDAPETTSAVQKVDDLVGKLWAGITASGLPVDLIVLSDHGMETLQGGWISLDKWADLAQFETSGPLLYAKSEADAAKAEQALQNASDKFKAYRRADVPVYLHYNANPREGDPVIVPTGPYPITAHDPNSAGGAARMPPVGGHGYDPRQMPSMKAIFYAAGPDIRSGVTIPSFENVDVFPLIARILGLSAGPTDGELRPLEVILKTSSKN